MLQRFMLRLMGLEQKPPEPFQGEVGGIAYHVDALPKGNVSIWIDIPRDRMRIEPTCFRKTEGSVSWSGNIERWIHPLFNMGAQSVDVGFSGDKLEVIVPAFMKKVDKELAEQMVVLMTHLRNEALGEQLAYEPKRPWSKEAEGSLDLHGRIVNFEFSSCLVHTEDDLAGNLDVMVRTNPSLPAEELSENLCLALPEFEELVKSDAYGQCDGGNVDVSFGLANSGPGFGNDVREAIKSLRDVDIFWGEGRERRLATLPCEFTREATS